MQSKTAVFQKERPYFYLRIYLLAAPALFGMYRLFNAGMNGTVFAEYLKEQPVNTIMLLLALLSVVWFPVLQLARDLQNSKQWKIILYLFISCHLLTGNLIAVVLGMMTLKQPVETDKLQPEKSIPSFILPAATALLLFLYLFCAFALVRITLV